jgi:hypothetical protein
MLSNLDGVLTEIQKTLTPTPEIRASLESTSPHGGGEYSGNRPVSYAIALPRAGRSDYVATSSPEMIRISKSLN